MWALPLLAIACIAREEAQVVHAETTPYRLEVNREIDHPERPTFAIIAQSADLWAKAAADDELVDQISGVYVVDETTGQPAPYSILCQHVLKDRTLLLEPKFALTPGLTYLIKFDPTLLAAEGTTSAPLLQLRYAVPMVRAIPAPELTGIYPSGADLPANHLKFYLVFSEPMQRGGIFKYFSLLDETGRTVLEPFREVELWAANDRQLTLWFHPGRQKDGVNLNVEFGPILEEGHSYTLKVSGDWPSAKGVPLGRDYQKVFRAGPPRHDQLSVDSWTVHPPSPGTTEPLTLVFPEPYDWALLQHALKVRHQGHGEPVPGVVRLGPQERGWIFTPETPWESGVYSITADPALEDLAGNSLARPFEVDLSKPAPPEGQTFQIRFELGPAGK